MPATHYIEIDEEIISTVGRLRKTSETENIFVFPKRSLILQSIINLKLLGREATKLGKTVIIMTQDEQGMRLAEKAGLRTQEYQDKVLREYRQEAPARFTVRHGDTIPMPVATDEPIGLRRSDEIGSESFYRNTGASSKSLAQHPNLPTTPVPSILARKPAQSLRVRNASPPMQTALNSTREVPKTPQSQGGIGSRREERSSVPNESGSRINGARKEQLRRLFEGRAAGKNTAGNPVPQLVSAPPSIPVSKQVISPQGQRPWLWSLLGSGLFIGVVLIGYFFLRPEAIIILEPQTATQTVKLSLVGLVDAGLAGETIPVRYIEEEKTVRISREATGKNIGNEAKASGTLTIINAFSEAPQSLVATTRFETSDGKIYRLIDGVTIPGMTTVEGKVVPGRIDARVIADMAGEKFNLSAGTLSIPGFKGGAKFDKITAEVKSALTGGGESAGTALRVSEGDREQAKTAASEEAKKTVIDGLMGSVQAGEQVFEPSFQVTTIGTPSAPDIGTVTERFEYEARFQVKGFIISKAAINNIIERQTMESGGVVLRPYRFAIDYGTVLSNFEMKRVDFTVESRVLFQAPLEKETLKNGLLGLDEEGIRKYLSEHPEIKRLQVEFKPKVFIATVPNDPERVTVNLVESSNE